LSEYHAICGVKLDGRSFAALDSRNEMRVISLAHHSDDLPERTATLADEIRGRCYSRVLIYSDRNADPSRY